MSVEADRQSLRWKSLVPRKSVLVWLDGEMSLSQANYKSAKSPARCRGASYSRLVRREKTMSLFFELGLPVRAHAVLGNHRRQSQQGWMELDCLSAVDREEETIWTADAYRDGGKRFVVRTDEILTTFLELESATCLACD
jgi:hypothetical protein